MKIIHGFNVFVFIFSTKRSSNVQDGLWDALNEDDVAITVYKMLRDDPRK